MVPSARAELVALPAIVRVVVAPLMECRPRQALEPLVLVLRLLRERVRSRPRLAAPSA